MTKGLYFGSEADYHGDKIAPKPSLSSGLGKLLLRKSPRHAWWESRRLNPKFVEKTSITFDIGKAAHRAVLGKGSKYLAYPDNVLGKGGTASTTAAKDFSADCRAADIVPLKSDVVEQIETMAEILRRRMVQNKIIIDPVCSEIVGIGEIDGCWVRAMFDNAPKAEKVLYDFKTTTDAHPETCIKTIENYGYDVQAAHYLDVWEAATGERREFHFIFQEKEPPFETAVIRLLNSEGHSADWMEDAKRMVGEARYVWKTCVDTNVWPGYPLGVIEVGAPHWRKSIAADREGRAAQMISRESLDRASAWMSPEGLQA